MSIIADFTLNFDNLRLRGHEWDYRDGEHKMQGARLHGFTVIGKGFRISHTFKNPVTICDRAVHYDTRSEDDYGGSYADGYKAIAKALGAVNYKRLDLEELGNDYHR